MGIAGEEHFADAFRLQQSRLIQRIIEHRFFEKAHLFRAMAIHKPFVVAINVSNDVRIVVDYAKQIAGNVAIQVMSKNQIAIQIVNARAIGGNHVRLNLQIIANLPHINVVTAGRKHKVDAARGEQLQSFFGVRG